MFIFKLATTLLFLSAPCSAETPPVPLEVQAGGKVSLPSRGIPLSGNHDFIWGVDQETLVSFENEQHKCEAPERYRGRLEVDLTGTLHITDLKLGDTGVYTGQIINGDGNVREVSYNVTVLDPVLTTQGPSSAAAQRHWTRGVGFISFLIVCKEYLFETFLAN